jgi:TRAP-type C4-dicarboxylate transport system permease small subunit
MKKIEAFKRSMIWKFLVQLQRWLMVASSIFVMLIMCLEVLLRYVFKSDLFGIEEIVVIAAFWLYFMGSSYGVYEKSHVKADIIPQMLSKKSQAFLTVIIRLTMSILCCIFTYWAVGMIKHSIEYMPRTTGLRIPIFISQFSVLLGYFFMALYSITYFLEDFFGFLELRRS